MLVFGVGCRVSGWMVLEVVLLTSFACVFVYRWVLRVLYVLCVRVLDEIIAQRRSTGRRCHECVHIHTEHIRMRRLNEVADSDSPSTRLPEKESSVRKMPRSSGIVRNVSLNNFIYAAEGFDHNSQSLNTNIERYFGTSTLELRSNIFHQ